MRELITNLLADEDSTNWAIFITIAATVPAVVLGLLVSLTAGVVIAGINLSLLLLMAVISRSSGENTDDTGSE